MGNVTYREFRAAVIDGIAYKTCWSLDQAANLVGDVSIYYDEAMTVDETVTDVLDASVSE